MNDKEIIGKGKSYLKGFAKQSILRTCFYSDSEIDEVLEVKLNKGTNKCEISNIEYDEFYSYENEIAIEYDFRIPDYVKNFDSLYFVNLNLDKYFQNAFLDTSRKTQVKLDFTTYKNTVYELALPKGFKPHYLPENKTFNSDDFSFRSKYSSTDTSINLYFNLEIKVIMLDLDKTYEWNNFIQELTNSYSKSIILKKINDENN